MTQAKLYEANLFYQWDAIRIEYHKYLSEKIPHFFFTSIIQLISLLVGQIYNYDLI